MKPVQALFMLLVVMITGIASPLSGQETTFPKMLGQMSQEQFAQWLVGTEWEYETEGETRRYWFASPKTTVWVVRKDDDAYRAYGYQVSAKGTAEWYKNPGARTMQTSIQVADFLTSARLNFGDKIVPAKLVGRRLHLNPEKMDVPRFQEWLKGRVLKGQYNENFFHPDNVIEMRWKGTPRRKPMSVGIVGTIDVAEGDNYWQQSMIMLSPDLKAYTVYVSWGTFSGTVRLLGTIDSGTVAATTNSMVSVDEAAAVPLKKTMSSLNGLMVVELGSSRYAGKASKLSISALKLESDKPATISFNQEVGKMMNDALKEVTRFHSLRHSGWPRGYRIELAYADKYSPKDGPSAAVACALAMESLLTGVELDPAFAVTGDLNADGTVQPIGGVTAKLRGATKSGMTVVAIPEKNRGSTMDLAITDGVAPFLGAQIFSIATFDQALALGRADKDPALKQSISQYTQLCTELSRNPAALRTPATVGTLTEIGARTPNHVAARLLLAMAQNSLPQRLSAAGSVDAVDQSVASVLEAAKSDINTSSSLDAGQIGAAKGRLQRLRTQVDLRVQPYVDAWLEWTQLADQYIGRRSAGGPIVAQLKQAGKKIDAELAKLQGNAEFAEELMR